MNYYLKTSEQSPYAELDPSCPSLLSWHLIGGSTYAAIVLLAVGLVLVVVPALALLFRCAKNHFVIQTVPYSPFEQQGAPLPTSYCPPSNQTYRDQMPGADENSPANFNVERYLASISAAGPAVADEGSIVSRNSRMPLTSNGIGRHSNTRSYGAGGGEVLSDDDFYDCSVSGIDQPAHADLAACRLVLRSDSVDPSDDGGSLVCNQCPGPRDRRQPATLKHLPYPV